MMSFIKNLFGKSTEEKLKDSVENKKYSEVKSLISQGVDVNCVYESKTTPLHLASIMGELSIAELLINNGANVNATTENGYNSLMVACIRNDIDLVELLLKNKSNTNQVSKYGWTPLIIASGNVSSNSIFFQNYKMGLEIFQVLNTRKLYILQNPPEKIVHLLMKSGSNVNQKNTLKNSPLDEAIFSCNTEVIKCLLDNGANVEDTTDFGDTPLIKVSSYTFHKYRESIINLLDRIWDIGGFKDDHKEFRLKIKGALLNNFKNESKNEQIEYFNSEILKIAQLLIRYGANITSKNSVGASAIIVASGEGNTKILEFLINSGADVNARYNTDMSALFIAAQKGNIDVIKVLLQNGADVNSPLNDGETALMTAVWFGNVDVVKLLVSKGANVNAKKITPYNKDGEKVLDWAAFKIKNDKDNRYVEIFNILHNAPLGQEKEYEKPYPVVHEALKSSNELLEDSFSINEPIYSIEYIKNKEIEEPTHWIYKHITDPVEMNYRYRSLQKSMIGQYDEVVKICLKGLEKYFDSSYLLYMLGRTLGDIGKATNDNQKFDKGITLFNHVIDLYPNFADVYVERGKIKVYLSDEDGAILDFLRAREIEADIALPFELDLKMCEIDLKKRDISRRFTGLGIVNNDYSSGLPKETNTLSDVGVGIVIDYLNKGKCDCLLYGSFPLMASILPAFKRIPGDIDIQLWTSKMEAEKFSNELFHRLKNAGEEVRLSPENPLIIESRKTGRWERAVDIHHMEESPEDNLSPLYPLDSRNIKVGKREKRKLLIDFLDVFRMMKTCIELAKQNNIEVAKINEAENLIIEWKNLFSELIDFDRLEIKEE